MDAESESEENDKSPALFLRGCRADVVFYHVAGLNLGMLVLSLNLNTILSITICIIPAPAMSAKMAADIARSTSRLSTETSMPLPFGTAMPTALHVSCSKRDMKPPAFQKDTSAPNCAND
jgi:hypothetical protein